MTYAFQYICMHACMCMQFWCQEVKHRTLHVLSLCHLIYKQCILEGSAQPTLREWRVYLPLRLEYIHIDFRILLNILFVFYLQLFYLGNLLEQRYLFGMFYILVIAILPYFLAKVFCELESPFCWLLCPFDMPKSRQDIVFWSIVFPSFCNTTSVLELLLTCSLGSGVEYFSRQHLSLHWEKTVQESK